MTTSAKLDADALLAFLPAFNDPATDYGTGGGDHFQESPFTLSFHQACYDAGFVLPDFDWCEWSRDRWELIETGEGTERLAFLDLARLITAHSRGSRQSAVHFLDVCRSGRMRRILTRLQELQAPERTA